MYVFCIDAVLPECVEEVDSDEEHPDGKLKIGHEHVQLDDETAGPSAVDTHDTEENVGYVCVAKVIRPRPWCYHRLWLAPRTLICSLCTCCDCLLQDRIIGY